MQRRVCGDKVDEYVCGMLETQQPDGQRTGSGLEDVDCLFQGEHAAHKAINAEPVFVDAFNVLPVQFGPRYVCVCTQNSLQNAPFHFQQPLLCARDGPRGEEQVVQCCDHALVRVARLRAQGCAIVK